ncbi:hypothetical protein G3495_14805 [Shewanella baltica]|uniref:hypothetical protein n=1 Tax=Shewanella baltica TaxID=62322 RepID=UPI00217E2ABA|nr:hypothetical protein [Shewanella baltica]MCS6162262.1 hypothetical protein [Shewanella baltica]MCS6236383.1 hypothetical protein [Shewanella baltica]MCS6258543.1 hypothetical protein [Shewanella baltica]MCS6269561.1 hypothetical protein [Shewanella baltica]
MNLKTANLSNSYSRKFTLLALLTIGTSISLSSHAAPLTISQQQAVNAHFSKLAQTQHAAETQMTEQLKQDFTQQLTVQEHEFMNDICPKYGMTFDVTTNACLRS